MGCGQSKIENEEAVTRCKDRKQFMKEAVSARNAFAAAHSAFTMSLKNTGAALSDFAHGEVLNPGYLPTTPTPTNPSSSPLHPHSAPSTSATGEPLPPPPPHLQSSYDTLLPPPPPFNNPSFSAVPLQRAASMPEIKLPVKENGSVPVGPTIIEEEAEDDDDDVDELEMEKHEEKLVTRKRRGSTRSDPPPPHPPPPVVVENRTASAMQAPELGWADYIFQTSQEGMMGPTLVAVQDEAPAASAAAAAAAAKVEEIEQRKVDVEEMRKSAKVEVVPEKVPVVEAVPPPVPVVGGGSGGSVGKSVKKGKASVGMGERRVVKAGSVNLLQIFVELDDHFLKASESAHEVSKLLEATRLHYHSNFADNRGNDLRLSDDGCCYVGEFSDLNRKNDSVSMNILIKE